MDDLDLDVLAEGSFGSEDTGAGNSLLAANEALALQQPTPRRPERSPSGPAPAPKENSRPPRDGGLYQAVGAGDLSPLGLGLERGTSGREPALPFVPSLSRERDDALQKALQAVAEALVGDESAKDLGNDSDAKLQARLDGALQQADTGGIDGNKLRRHLTRELNGLGPLRELLEDPDVIQVQIERYDRIVVQRNEELVELEAGFSHPRLMERCVRRLLQGRGEGPAIGARLDDGTRVSALLPPLALDSPALHIRKPRHTFPSLEELEQRGALTSGMAEFLRRAVEAGRSMLIAGPAGAGKTTLVAALAELLPRTVRIVSVEEIAQLRLPPPPGGAPGGTAAGGLGHGRVAPECSGASAPAAAPR